MSPKPAKVRIFSYSRSLSILLITILLLGGQPVQPAQAATITVDTLVDENDHSCIDGDCSLRDAIETAVGGDTIEFDVSGTITLGGTELSFNKNLTISGPGVGSLSISGDDISRIFSIGSSATVTISGLTITKGMSTYGGGISTSGTLTLNNCIISGNNSDSGGGIYIWQNTVTINNSIISDNHSVYIGGGIDARGDSLTVNNSTVSGNDAVNHGGGIHNEQGTVTLNNSTVSGNSTDGNGGGIQFNEGVLIANNSTISGNSAGWGGGILAVDGTITLKHTSITNNTADVDGGGIYTQQLSGTSTTNFENTLVAGNFENDGTGAEDCYNNGGTLVSQDYNLTGVGTGCTLGGAHDQTTADAKLLALADNGGDTETHALDAGGPAINQIPTGTNGCGTTYTEDQRGVSRPQGTHCDIGAFELEQGSVIADFDGDGDTEWNRGV